MAEYICTEGQFIRAGFLSHNCSHNLKEYMKLSNGSIDFRLACHFAHAPTECLRAAKALTRLRVAVLRAGSSEHSQPKYVIHVNSNIF